MATVLAQEKATVPWWLILLEGISLLIIGALLLANPAKTSTIVVQVLGIYWLISGIFQIIGIFMDPTAWGWKLFAGILGILAGIVVINHPLWSPLVIGGTIVIILGIQGIVYGGIGIYQAFKGAGWGAGILGGLSILFGIVLLANIWVATFSLPWVLGVFAIVGGIMAIAAAFKAR